MSAEFACDVRTGLSKPQKELPSAYFYDEVGSALFEAITVLPEYGLTRADQRLLARLARELPDSFQLVAELGSGSGKKTRLILEQLTREHPVTYYPIDLSPVALAHCAEQLGDLAVVKPLEHSYLDGVLEVTARCRDKQPLIVLFLGSTIGNFDRACRDEFLSQLRALLQPGDALLLGCDLVKPLERMLLAYDDPAGVTAAFNLNLLARINRELDADFLLRCFTHEVRYDHAEQRIEMHLRSGVEQQVTIRAAGFTCALQAGETIWTESSHKFRAEEIPEMARRAGFVCRQQWIDELWPFSESLWIAG